MKKWFQCHECVRRALRTFLQTAAGVVVAAVIDAAGVVQDVNVKAVIILAVATGLSAAMNLTAGAAAEVLEESEKKDGD